MQSKVIYVSSEQILHVSADENQHNATHCWQRTVTDVNHLKPSGFFTYHQV
jgi:hypothetical protein